MNEQTFKDYRKNRYETQIAWYDTKAIWNHRAYRVFQWTAIILSALTPICIILGTGWIKWLAVGIAVIVAISTAALKGFKYQENWIGFRTTCETLKKEIHFYDADIQGYDGVDDKEALFVERVETLISRENTLWVTTHEKEEHIKKK